MTFCCCGGGTINFGPLGCTCTAAPNSVTLTAPAGIVTGAGSAPGGVFGMTSNVTPFPFTVNFTLPGDAPGTGWYSGEQPAPAGGFPFRYWVYCAQNTAGGATPGTFNIRAFVRDNGSGGVGPPGVYNPKNIFGSWPMPHPSNKCSPFLMSLCSNPGYMFS